MKNEDIRKIVGGAIPPSAGLSAPVPPSTLQPPCRRAVARLCSASSRARLILVRRRVNLLVAQLLPERLLLQRPPCLLRKHPLLPRRFLRDDALLQRQLQHPNQPNQTNQTNQQRCQRRLQYCSLLLLSVCSMSWWCAPFSSPMNSSSPSNPPGKQPLGRTKAPG